MERIGSVRTFSDEFGYVTVRPLTCNQGVGDVQLTNGGSEGRGGKAQEEEDASQNTTNTTSEPPDDETDGWP